MTEETKAEKIIAAIVVPIFCILIFILIYILAKKKINNRYTTIAFYELIVALLLRAIVCVIYASK